MMVMWNGDTLMILHKMELCCHFGSCWQTDWVKKRINNIQIVTIQLGFSIQSNSSHKCITRLQSELEYCNVHDSHIPSLPMPIHITTRMMTFIYLLYHYANEHFQNHRPWDTCFASFFFFIVLSLPLMTRAPQKNYVPFVFVFWWLAIVLLHTTHHTLENV